jgi:hypothetical protein
VEENTPTIVPPAVAAPGPRERTGDRGDRGDRGPREDRDDRYEREPAADAAGE